MIYFLFGQQVILFIEAFLISLAGYNYPGYTGALSKNTDSVPEENKNRRRKRNYCEGAFEPEV